MKAPRKTLFITLILLITLLHFSLAIVMAEHWDIVNEDFSAPIEAYPWEFIMDVNQDMENFRCVFKNMSMLGTGIYEPNFIIPYPISDPLTVEIKFKPIFDPIMGFGSFSFKLSTTICEFSITPFVDNLQISGVNNDASFHLEDGVWITLRVVAEGANIKVWKKLEYETDFSFVIEQNMANPENGTMVQFFFWAWNEDEAWLDYIKIASGVHPPGDKWDVPTNGIISTMGVGEGDGGTCEYNIFNASSIMVIAGNLDIGNLASTYHVDGDWYDVSEVVGSPGLDIRFNFTDIGGNITCGCVEIYKTYTGHSHHEIQIQVWNFTSGSWHKIGKALYNETIDWVCVGLGHTPEHYMSGGEAWFRFYHPLTGHIKHTLRIERIDLRVIYAKECPPCEEVPALVAMAKYYAMAIILLILGILLGLGMRKR